MFLILYSGESSRGCILGNPSGGPNDHDHVVVEGYSQTSIKAKEAASSSPESLALKLMDVFFSRHEMAEGSCHKSQGEKPIEPYCSEWSQK